MAKQRILDEIMKNEKLLFQWTLLTADADDSVGREVLKRILNFILQFEGLPLYKFCLEMYKQHHRKGIQKSKALHKKIARKRKIKNNLLRTNVLFNDKSSDTNVLLKLVFCFEFVSTISHYFCLFGNLLLSIYNSLLL